MEHVLLPTPDPAWVLSVDGYDPLRESSEESRFAIGNGFLGVRAARSTTRGGRWVVPARTYVAGLFDANGASNELVPAADWLAIRILLRGDPLLHHPRDVQSHRMTLDMKRGALLSEGHHLAAPGLDIRAHTLRLVSLSDRGIGLQLIRVEIEDGAFDVTLEASFEGVRLGLVTDLLEQDIGLWHTQHSGKHLAMATAPSLQIDGLDCPATELGDLKWSWSWKTRPGQTVWFHRCVAIVRGDVPDVPDGAAGREAHATLGRARQIGWRGIVAAHEAAWITRWHSSDVTVDGDADAQIALRFAVYHLNSAANPADERVSIGARALTGDDYHGHVFWDTEIFLLPFYCLTWPEAARSLLMYRFHTLDGARAKAAGMGWSGALYAWESADTGAEMTPAQVIGPDHRIIDVLCGKQEQHISADVAYAVWQYWQATGDDGFMLDAGAEILLETARFWASRARLEADRRYHIRGVIGPDEYHEHIDDNAYTNVMARWNIRRALDIAAWMRERWPVRWIGLAGRLGLGDAELKQWLNVAEALATGLDPETGLFEQFAGYFALEDIDLTQYAGRGGPMDVVLGRERTQKSRVVKQADVVALLGLLPEEFATGTDARNFRYYEPRCSHGSSLSPAMHGLVAARLGDTEMAMRFFRQTAAIDLADTHAGADGGIHIAALGGLWMLAVFGFAGLSFGDGGIAIEPRLPDGWASLAFRVQWRGRHLRFRIDRAKQTVEATLEAGEPMTLTIGGNPRVLGSAAGLVASIRPPGAPAC